MWNLVDGSLPQVHEKGAASSVQPTWLREIPAVCRAPRTVCPPQAAFIFSFWLSFDFLPRFVVGLERSREGHVRASLSLSTWPQGPHGCSEFVSCSPDLPHRQLFVRAPPPLPWVSGTLQVRKILVCLLEDSFCPVFSLLPLPGTPADSVVLLPCCAFSAVAGLWLTGPVWEMKRSYCTFLFWNFCFVIFLTCQVLFSFFVISRLCFFQNASPSFKNILYFL